MGRLPFRATWQSAKCLLRTSYWVHFLIVLAYLTNLSLFLMGVGRNGPSGAGAWVLMGPAAAVVIGILRARLFAVAPIIQALRVPNAAAILPRTAFAVAVVALLPPILCSWYFGISWLLLLVLVLATVALGLNFLFVLIVGIVIRALVWLIEHLVPDFGSRLFDGLAALGITGLLIIVMLLLVYTWRRDLKRWRQILMPEPSLFQVAHFDIESGAVYDPAPKSLASHPAGHDAPSPLIDARRDESSEDEVDPPETARDALVEHANQAAKALAQLTQHGDPVRSLLALKLGPMPGWPTTLLPLVVVGAAVVQGMVGYTPDRAYLPPPAIVLIVLYAIIPMVHALRLIDRLVCGSPSRVLAFGEPEGKSRIGLSWWEDHASASDTLILMPGFPRGSELRFALLRRLFAWSLHSTALMVAALLAVLLVAAYQVGIDHPVQLLRPNSWLGPLVMVGVANLAAVCVVLVWSAHRWLERKLLAGALALTFGLATLPIGLLAGINWASGWFLPPLLAAIWLYFLLPARPHRLLPQVRQPGQ